MLVDNSDHHSSNSLSILDEAAFPHQSNRNTDRVSSCCRASLQNNRQIREKKDFFIGTQHAYLIKTEMLLKDQNYMEPSHALMRECRLNCRQEPSVSETGIHLVVLITSWNCY